MNGGQFVQLACAALLVIASIVLVSRGAQSSASTIPNCGCCRVTASLIRM